MTFSNELVLYKDDKAIVLYSKTGDIKALPLYDLDSQTRECSNNLCPLCGSLLSGSRYTYIAKAYFQLLQRNFQGWQSTNHKNIFHTVPESEENADDISLLEGVNSDDTSGGILPLSGPVEGSTPSPRRSSFDPLKLSEIASKGSSELSSISDAVSGGSGEMKRDLLVGSVKNRAEKPSRCHVLSGQPDNVAPYSSAPLGNRMIVEGHLPYVDEEIAYKRLNQSRMLDIDADLQGFSEKRVVEDIEPPKNIPKELLVTGYYNRFFLERRKLGFGSFGHVYYCIHVLDELVLGEYAVKKLAVGDDMNWLRKIIREVKVRENLRHRNIVDYNHSWLEMYRLNELCPYVPWLFILMEYCNGGDLEKFITNVYNADDISVDMNLRRRNVSSHSTEPNPPKFPELSDGGSGGLALYSGKVSGSTGSKEGSTPWDNDVSATDKDCPSNLPKNYLDESEIWVIFLDILNGLCHLHRHGVLYRDLKASNVLLSYSSDEFRAVLSDFGTAEILNELRDCKTQRQGFTGTVEYTAPELLHTDNKGEFSGNYDTKTDIWSLGIILYFLTYGSLPYFDADPKICRKLILEHSTLKLPNTYNRSKILKMLILVLTNEDPMKRPECESILNDVNMTCIFEDRLLLEGGLCSLLRRVSN